MPASEVERPGSLDLSSSAAGRPDRPSDGTSNLVVAIDGPSGSGKSTVARGVASALGLRYLDTGAMYRALTWWVLDRGIDRMDTAAVGAAASALALTMSTDPARPTVQVGDRDVTAAIRGATVTAAVSGVSAVPQVRAVLVARQRDIIGAGGIVVEGRDIGTTVWPTAPVKIFLTASADARATRRSLDESARESGAAALDPVQVRHDLDRRDDLDSNRATSPLAQAPDAIALDSTGLDAAAVIAAVVALVEVAARPAMSESIGVERR